jgi:hypothetical protein
MKSNRSLLQSSARAVALGVAACFFIPASSATDPNIGKYFVGVDGRETIPSGDYAGLANPNFGRLTFLFAHTYVDTPNNNHYHSKGIYVYTGPNLGPDTAVTIGASNFLPEGNRPPLLLTPGSGLYAGKLVSNPYTDPSDTNYPFSFLQIQDTGALAGFAAGTPEEILFNSSGGRWNGSLLGADVHLELVFLSPGLNLGSLTAMSIMSQPGDDFHLDDSFAFTPVFWTEANAALGTYVARLKLTDENGLFGNSGTFEFRFQVIPEPSTYAIMLGVAVLGLAFWRRRRSR